MAFPSTFLCFFSNIYIFFHLFLKFLRDGAGEDQNFYTLTFEIFHFVLFMLHIDSNYLIISMNKIDNPCYISYILFVFYILNLHS